MARHREEISTHLDRVHHRRLDDRQVFPFQYQVDAETGHSFYCWECRHWWTYPTHGVQFCEQFIIHEFDVHGCHRQQPQEECVCGSRFLRYSDWLIHAVQHTSHICSTPTLFRDVYQESKRADQEAVEARQQRERETVQERKRKSFDETEAEVRLSRRKEEEMKREAREAQQREREAAQERERVKAERILVREEKKEKRREAKRLKAARKKERLLAFKEREKEKRARERREREEREAKEVKERIRQRDVESLRQEREGHREREGHEERERDHWIPAKERQSVPDDVLLTEHLRLVDTHQCAKCLVKFKSLQALLSHEASRHGMHGSTFPCPACGREFETRLGRLQHVLASEACGGEQAAAVLYVSSVAEEDSTYLRGLAPDSENANGVVESVWESSEDTDPAVDTVCVSPLCQRGQNTSQSSLTETL
ncbi:hypothetical protein KIPB_002646 [Kipferlia bialata]|uniref:C2H2-type domain-containing protein n=1 Tax=Kipferlia bialata TaxID=797122 RepID=A0A9K3CT70_9EUKA|nr:hypothetical protein KIPB_002646 [Kipferlia bialata]|eukprot:g2646.t1